MRYKSKDKKYRLENEKARIKISRYQLYKNKDLNFKISGIKKNK